MIRAVIFDMDDTLISEKEYVKSGYMAVAKDMASAYSSQISSAQECFVRLLDCFSKGSRQVFNEVLRSYKLADSKEEVSKWITCYRCHTPEIQFYDDVLPCLAMLRSHGISTGLLSDGYLETQTRKCKALGIYELFDKVVLTEELGREFWKPHPRGFELIRDFFDCQWQEMVYVGDNPQKDFHIRANYPIHTVEIKRDDQVYLDRPYLDNIKPEFSIHTLAKLPLLLSTEF